MSGNDTLLRALVADVFQEPTQQKTAAQAASPAKPAQPGKTKIATGITSTPFVKKLASAIEFIAQGLTKQAAGGPEGGLQFGMGSGVPADPYMTEAENIGGDYPVRQSAAVDGTDLAEAVTGAGVGFTPGDTPGWGGATSYPLGAQESQETDEEKPGGLGNAAGIDFADLMGPGHGTSKTASPQMRAKAAMDRVLGKAKAAAIKRAQQADASIPPPGTTGEPLAAPSGTEESSSFTPESSTLASEVPQSTEAVIGLTNQDADKANQAALENALGTQAVAAADADTTREEVFEGASGDGDSGPTEKEALASILNANVLARIAQGG